MWLLFETEVSSHTFILNCLLFVGTFDFYGMNHYSTRLATFAKKAAGCHTCWGKDVGVELHVDPKWNGSASKWLKVVPWGFRRLLNFVRVRYGNVPVIVTENGFSDTDGLKDGDRIDYYHVSKSQTKSNLPDLRLPIWLKF